MRFLAFSLMSIVLVCTNCKPRTDSKLASNSSQGELYTDQFNPQVYTSYQRLDQERSLELMRGGFRIMYMPGDVDFDGVLTMNDVEIMERALQPGATPRSCIKEVLDLDQDGFASMTDVDLLRDIVQRPNDETPSFPVRFRYSLQDCPTLKVSVSRKSCSEIEFRPVERYGGSFMVQVLDDQERLQVGGFNFNGALAGSAVAGAPEQSLVFTVLEKKTREIIFDINISGFRYTLAVGSLGHRLDECEDSKSINKSGQLDLPSHYKQEPNPERYSTVWSSLQPRRRLLPPHTPKKWNGKPQFKQCFGKGKSPKGHALAVQMLTDWALDGKWSGSKLNSSFRALYNSIVKNGLSYMYWNLATDSAMRYAPKRNMYCHAFKKISWDNEGNATHTKTSQWKYYPKSEATAGKDCRWTIYSGRSMSAVYLGKYKAASSFRAAYDTWKKDMTQVQKDLDSWVRETADRVKGGSSALLLYVGAHGSEPSKSHPYGYWSTGVSGYGPDNSWHGVYLDRDKYLTTLVGAARQGEVCNFLALDDSCYGQIPKWGREKASHCADRPAHFNGKYPTYPVNRFLSVGHRYRTAKGGEANARVYELSRQLDNSKLGEFNKGFGTRNFGDEYADYGQNQPGACK